MVVIAQVVEPQFVALVVAGSIPVNHPWKIALVAQLDRAPDFESVGRRFESCRARLFSKMSYSKEARHAFRFLKP